jgi:hypothetical protein
LMRSKRLKPASYLPALPKQKGRVDEMVKLKDFMRLACMAFLAVMAIATLTLTPVDAQGQPKAEWKAPKAKKTKAVRATPPPPAPTPTPPPANDTESSSAPNPSTDMPPAASPTPPIVQDQSQEVLDTDLVMAALVKAQGPKVGYGSTLSEVGVLYDANGASPAGVAASESRFANFPADVVFERTPERAIAAGGSGSSWGAYAIKRGEQVLSAGRYISVWRREASGWRMISELAAGKTTTPPPATPVGGTLPKRPAQLGRAAPAPIGVPLTVPTTPPVTSETAATPTPPAN